MNDQDVLAALDKLSDEDFDRVLAQLMLAEDFPSYAKAKLKVQTPRHKVVAFDLNRPQQILHRIIEDKVRPNRLVRLIALKARRMGFSTYFSGRFYQNTSNKPNRYAIQITHEPDATDFLFKMVKRFHNLSPKQERPETLYNNARLMEFNNADGTGLDSAFRVATAGKDDVGSGQLIHYLHLSEVAKWPQHNIKSLLTSIEQVVPDEDDTAVVFESTAKGIGGEFYDRFWGAKYRIWISKLDKNGEAVIEESVNADVSEDNVYTSVFLPWFCFDEYEMPVPHDFKLTEDERKIMDRHNLRKEQMAWRRFTIANKCGGQVDTFNQEYPDTPQAAFLGTGRPVFNNVRLMNMREEMKDPVARYELFSRNWVNAERGRLSVWKEPSPYTSYIVSADVAEGLADGDFSCADVIDHTTGEQVAHWHGNIDHDNVLEFADILAELGRRYNDALMVVERNNHGLGVVTQLYQYGYPNLYAEMVPDPPGRPRKRYGWVTSRSTRPLIVDNLIAEVQDDDSGINCKETIDEMLSFKIQDNGKMEADSGRHDDRVISLAIGKHIRQVSDLPSMKKIGNIKRRERGGRKKRVSNLAWT